MQQEDDDEGFDFDENSPLIPIAIPQLIEIENRNKNYSSQTPFGRVVIFSDKPVICNKKMTRARSCSPGLECRTRSPNWDGHQSLTPTSILKNPSNFYEHSQCRSMIGKIGGKSTLQRTKSSPAPSSSQKKSGFPKPKSIPVPIPCPPKLHNCSNSKMLSRSNPLLNVSWNCPTLEKRKDVILNYFKYFGGKSQNKTSRDGQQINNSEPIYEEIGHDNKMDSLKPKLPKKVRLNLLPSYENTDKDLEQDLSIYDKVLDPSPSFSFDEKNDWVKWKDSLDDSGIRNITPEQATTKIDNFPTSEIVNLDENNNCNSTITPGKQLLPKEILRPGLCLADFASQVAQKAKVCRNKNSLGRSTSFCYGLNKNSFSSDASPTNDEELPNFQTHHSNVNDSVCVTDEIYLRLDKRGKKFGTPTTRLLKRHQSHNLGKSLPNEDLYINDTSNPCRVTHATESAPQPQDNTKLEPIYANMNILQTSTSCTDLISLAKNKHHNLLIPKKFLSKSDIVSVKSEDSETESGFSMDSSSACEEENICSKITATTTHGEGKTVSTSDSCYSCTNSSISNSSTSSSSSEEESESRHPHQQQVNQVPQTQNQAQRFNPQHPPVRPARASNKAKALKKIPPSSQIPNSITIFDTQENKIVESHYQENNPTNFITNVNVLDKLDNDVETELKKEILQNRTGFINLADVFPHIDHSQNRKKSVLTISVIDCETSTPTSYPYPVPNSESKLPEKSQELIGDTSYNNFDKKPQSNGGCINLEDWYRSLQKGTVLLDDSSVLVTHQTPKDNSSRNISISPLISGTDYCVNNQNISSKQVNFDPKLKLTVGNSGAHCGSTRGIGGVCEKIPSSEIQKPQGDHFSEVDDIKVVTMSASTLMTPTSIQGRHPYSLSVVVVKAFDLIFMKLCEASKYLHNKHNHYLVTSNVWFE